MSTPRARLTIPLLAILTAAAGPLHGEDAAPPPVAIPAWVRETTGVGYTLSGMTREAREEAVRHGVTISEMNFVDPFYPYYDSRLLRRRSPHVPVERIREEIAEYRRLGVRILAVCPPTLQAEVWESHPEWRRIATDTREIPEVDLERFPHGGMLCLLGPYGGFFVSLLEEILRTHPEVDAFSFDGLHHGGGCWCASCRAAYRAERNAEIPPADLDDAAIGALDAWVRGGGGLVASLDASLCTPLGDSRGALALAEVLGVDHRGPATSLPGDVAEIDVNFARSLPPDWHERRRGIFRWRSLPGTFLAADPTLAALVGTDPVTFKGPAVRVEPRPGTEILATIEAEGGGAPLPAVTARRHGRGRAVYLAAGVDAAYWRYPYPYQRRVLAAAIGWAAGDRPPPVRVAAPMCVHATVRRQPGGRLVVHLFNDVNTTGGHALGTDDVPLREETVPIHGIRVGFAPGSRWREVRLEPFGTTLEVTDDGHGPGVTVPRLDVHAMVVAEPAE